MRFKVGELIKGTERSPYNLTNDKSICKVIKVYEGGYDSLDVIVVEHEINKKYIGGQYRVQSKYFVPVSKRNYIEECT